ncbi:MAG: epoxyqueuosine reductase QueH [bacterium]|nr:epoxyqueuosine reductase QueH [bacterium]
MNYQLKLEEILSKIDVKEYTPKLLLHACCGPCSSYVLEYLSNYFEITILYYNPNIYPEVEYLRRLNELKMFLKKFKTKNKVTLIECNYNTKEYDNAVNGLESLGERSKRCYNCYNFRMDASAKYASENNFDYFTTTLSISPYKNSSWINEIGEKLESKYNVKFLYSDFKKKNGYKRSLELSREYNLYRQDYCGCIYSKKEREKSYESV